MPLSTRTYLILLAILIAERLYELTLARRNARRAFARGAIEVGTRHYRAMVAVHAMFIVSCAIESEFFARTIPALLGWSALAGWIAAIALRYWSIWTLGERWNTRIIVIPGASPIRRGPYRFLRHPNYLAVAIEMIAVPLLGGAVVTAVTFSILNAILLAIRIPAEEHTMGAAYARDFARYRRLIPRLRTRRSDL